MKRKLRKIIYFGVVGIVLLAVIVPMFNMYSQIA